MPMELRGNGGPVRTDTDLGVPTLPAVDKVGDLN
jgi:hypothetical protein